MQRRVFKLALLEKGIETAQVADMSQFNARNVLRISSGFGCNTQYILGSYVKELRRLVDEP